MSRALISNLLPKHKIFDAIYEPFSRQILADYQKFDIIYYLHNFEFTEKFYQKIEKYEGYLTNEFKTVFSDYSLNKQQIFLPDYKSGVWNNDINIPFFFSGKLKLTNIQNIFKEIASQSLVYHIPKPLFTAWQTQLDTLTT